jgi:hypothetical protein
MMNRMMATVGLCFLLAGCAIGNTFDYRGAVPELTATTGKNVVVVAVDQRPYVLAGDNTPQWVGMFRGGFGNPFGAHTASGAPLADDVAVALVAGLRAKGVNAVVASSQTTASASQRKLSVTIKDWRSDTMVNTLIRYDLRADVMDATGTVLASNSVKNERSFSTFNNLPSTTAAEVLVHFKAIMADLLNAPALQNALL